jgi:hypothetical protein
MLSQLNLNYVVITSVDRDDLPRLVAGLVRVDRSGAAAEVLAAAGGG